jgi:hypothetical protein
MGDAFEKNIFINCPFDEEYTVFLKPLLFTVMLCGFNPRIASERFDSSVIRLSKIKELIESSKYSIHDLSRIKSDKKNEYYRLNMPFEIGLDLGCKFYHPDEKYREKSTLVIEQEPYSSKKALSDLAGFDVQCYKGEELYLVVIIRNWLSECSQTSFSGGEGIWEEYNEFYSGLYAELRNQRFSDKEIEALPISEFLSYIRKYLTAT